MIYILNYNRLGAGAGDEIELSEEEGSRLWELGFVSYPEEQYEDTLEAEIEPQPEEDEPYEDFDLLEDEPTDGGENKED